MRRPTQHWAVAALCFAFATCSDPATTTDPAAEFDGIIQISRDTAILELGDSVGLRVEVRQKNGPVVNQPITWTVVSPAVAEAGLNAYTTRFYARGAGSTRVIASAGKAADTAWIVVRRGFTATELGRHLDTLDALTATDSTFVISRSLDGDRLGRYTFASRNSAVVQASSLVHDTLRFRAQAAGATWIVVSEQAGTADSIRVVVHQKETGLRIMDGAELIIGQTRQLDARVEDRLEKQILGKVIAYLAVTPSVATISATGLVTAVGRGTTAIIATSPAGFADTVEVRVAQQQPALDSPDTLFVSVGLYSDELHVANDPGVWTHVTLQDTSLVTVVDSALGGTNFRVSGRKAGRTVAISTGANRRPDTMVVDVSRPRLHISSLNPLDPRATTHVGRNEEIRFFITDSLGNARVLSTPITVTVTSKDLAKATVDEPPFVYGANIPPGDVGWHYNALAAGETFIVGSAPGLVSDSVRVQVSAGPALQFHGPNPFIVGVTQSTRAFEVILRSTEGQYHPTNIPLTFTRKHPAVASVVPLPEIDTDRGGIEIPIYANLQGTDTIIASSPGYEPDTLIVIATTGKFNVPSTLTMSAIVAGFGFGIDDSTGKNHPAATNIPLTLTPADLTVAPVAHALVELGRGGDGISFLPLKVGSTTLTFTDDLGAYAPATIAFTAVADTMVKVFPKSLGSYANGPAAPGQVYYGLNVYVRAIDGAPSRTVQVHSTDPSVLTVPATSVTGEPVEVVAGTTAGSARIVIEAPWLRPDTSGSFPVAQGHLDIEAPDKIVLGATGYTATVRAENQLGHALPQAAAATFALTAVDAGLTVPANVTVPAGNGSVTFPIAATGTGLKRFIARDNRGLPTPYLPDSVAVLVTLPRLTFEYRWVGFGQRLDTRITRPGNLAGPAVTASLTRLGNHTATPEAAEFPAGLNFATVSIEGLKNGVDSLIIAAPGYATDTVAVEVTDGTAQGSYFAHGDSAIVRLYTADARYNQHAVREATEFRLTLEGALVTQGGVAITTLVVPIGRDASDPFIVRLPAGATSGTVYFSNLHYEQATFTFRR